MWSDNEIAALRRYKEQKKGAPTIAKLLGKTVEEVETELRTFANVMKKDKGKKIKAESLVYTMWFEQKIQNVETISRQTGLSPIDVATIISKLQKDFSPAQVSQNIADLAGYTEEEVFNKKTRPIFWDKKQEGVSPLDLLTKLEDFRRAVKAYDTEQASCTVQINDVTANWIMLIIMGDLHIGSCETNHTQILEDFRRIAATPNCYVGFTGDATDNWTKTLPLGIHEQLISPEGQRSIFRELAKILKNKLLFMVHGCHDNFSITNDDYNLIKEVARDLDVPYLGYGGKTELLINDNIIYKGTYWHKRPGSSQTNIFQPCIKTLLTHDCDNDIVSVSHNHISGAILHDFQGRNVALLRTGSYKAADRFAKKLGHGPVHDTEYQRNIPCVLLNTQQKDIRVCQTFDEGFDLLNYLNGKKTNSSAATGSDPSGK